MINKSIIILSVFTLVILQGCHSNVKVEPFVFSHEDEVVRNDDFIALADRRVFAVMAFMNASGYDDQVAGQEMHPVRLKVRQAIEEKVKNYPEELERWKKYYKENINASFSTLDFALSLNDDYPFRRIRPDSEIGYSFAEWKLSDFPDVLNEFWEKLELEQIWEQVKPDYLKEINKYDFGLMSKQLSFVWEYLRMQRKDNYIFISVPNLLDKRYHAIGAQYENYYYAVESPGAYSVGFNVHEYLHSIVNPLMNAKYSKQQKKLDKYYKAGKDMPMAKSYQHRIGYASECLVRALDHKIGVLMTDNPASINNHNRRVTSLTIEGLLLVKPFYDLLVEFEESEMNFEQFLPVMLERLPDYEDFSPVLKKIEISYYNY